MNETPPQNQPPAPPPPAPAVPPPTLTPAPEAPNSPAAKAPMSPYLYALIAFIVGLGAAYVLITQFPGSKVSETGNEKKAAKALLLPGEAIKVHACVNQKGELFAKPDDLPNGPIFMVANNKVVGLEYVLNQEDFNQGKAFEQLQTLDGTVNHMQVATMSADFNGKDGTYYVIDLYTVDKKTKDGIICNIPSPTVPAASPSADISSAPSATVSQSPAEIPAVIPSPATTSPVPGI
jgi:hypothetical protein